MIPIVKRNINQLQQSDRTFRAVYEIIRREFSREVFSEQLHKGQVVTTTYEQLFQLTDRYAAAFCARTLGKEPQIIAIHMENSVDWVACFWGILKSGNTPLLLNTRQDSAVTAKLVKALEPLLVITQDQSLEHGIRYEELSGDAVSDPEMQREWGDRILMVTSGTTKDPKVIAHRGWSICSQILLSADILKKNITLRHNRKLEVRMLAFLPFYHIFGLVAVLMWFSFFGRTFLFLPDYGADTIRQICTERKVSHFFAVPQVWEIAVRKLLYEAQQQNREKTLTRAIHFSNRLQTIMPHIGPGIVRNLLFRKVRKQMFGNNLHFLITGGGAISAAALELLNGLGYSLYQGYGLTECGIVSVNLSRKAGKRLDASCGEIFSHIRYRQNDRGELEISRENCFEGMVEDGQLKLLEQEYYCTGDIVRIDPEGVLTILGRSDSLIITENGENLSPEAVECLLPLESFRSGTLVYVPCDGKKQLILALEMEETDSALQRAKALKKLFEAMNRLPMSQRPGKVWSIAGEIPRGIKGVSRNALTKMLSENRLFVQELYEPGDPDIAQYQSSAYQEVVSGVMECFRKVIPDCEALTDTSNFISLGGNSMLYVELMQAVSERFSVNVQFTGTPMLTPAAFAEYVMKEQEKH